MGTTLYPFAPAPDPATSGDPKAQALSRVLGKADLYGDRGDSTATIESIINGVDTGRAARTQAGWDARVAGLKQSGDQYVDNYSAALQQLRRGSGGGQTPAWQAYEPDYSWLDELMGRMLPPAPLPGGGVTRRRARPVPLAVGGDRARELAARGMVPQMPARGTMGAV